LKNNFIKRL